MSINAGSKNLRSCSRVLMSLVNGFIGKTKILALLSSLTASKNVCPGSFKTNSELLIHIPKQLLTEASK